MKKTLTLAFLFLICFRVFSQTAPLSLPFFDDFARYNRLDTTKWLPGTSAYLNDHFSKNPVSKNIVTFNGVSATGALSQSTSSSNVGIDTLTSRPINLAGRSAADSVYFSFYVQTGGVGGMPNFSTIISPYFEVEFKDNNGNWQQAQRILPVPVSQRTLDFKFYVLTITDAKYLHNNFQFRFRNFGKRSETSDTWNLDYVVLDFGTKKNKPGFDVTTSRRVSSLLQKYTAMPIHQFMADISNSLNDSVYTTLNNYENDFRGITTTSTIQIGTGTPVTFATHQIPLRPRYLQYDSFPDKPNASFFSGLSGFQTIKSTVYVSTGETITPYTRYNDTISRTTELRDYYAYDDGSAESIVSYVFQNGQVGQVAMRFDLNQQDRVKSISVYLPKLGNTRNTIATFKLWNVDANGNPDGNGIFSKVFTVPDLVQLDNWFEIPVDPSVIVNGSFFAGWTISRTQPLMALGLDLNQNNPIRFNDFSTNWSTKNLGTLMLRVAMNNNITGVADDVANASLRTKIYPNPASDYVMLQGEFETVKILNATGQTLLERKSNGAEMRLETQSLKPGFYLVQVLNKGRIETHKLIIQAN